MTPWMWIIAGPNGAAKSSFADEFLGDLHAAFPDQTGPDGLAKLNADERTREFQPKTNLDGHRSGSARSGYLSTKARSMTYWPRRWLVPSIQSFALNQAW